MESATQPASEEPSGPKSPLTPDEALAKLLDGNARYLDESVLPEDYSARTVAAIKDLFPIAGILGCADARVASELIFDCGAGDLFMVRVAGNFLSEYGLASLEYCVQFLGTPLLMVLGHTQCGAVTAALKTVQERTPLPGRMPFLIDAIEPAVHIAQRTHPEDLLNASIIENVKRQVHRLSTLSNVLDAAVQAGHLKIVGAVYDLSTGKVTLV
ncbi:MAG: carbonic anhydrase [Thermomicrobiales bacterium]